MKNMEQSGQEYGAKVILQTYVNLKRGLPLFIPIQERNFHEITFIYVLWTKKWIVLDKFDSL
jgi:hypothetical protein